MTDYSRQTLLNLSEELLQKNKEFTAALKQNQSRESLQAIHSQIQEVYNHIALFQQIRNDRNLSY